MPGTVSPQDWKSLQAMLPAGAVVTNPIELIPYEVDGSLGQGAAQGVVLARATEEVARIVRWAAERKVPVVARGAGTGLSGGAVAPHGGIILSLARMKQILELDEAGRSVVVQPGVVHQTLDEFVKTKGLYSPPDPASGRACTLGGNLAENAGGPHCFKYGVTTNYVNGLKVVLADGRVIHTGGRAFDYPEYDLTGLLVGSEGTLGIMTEAELRLVRNIPGVKTLMAIFNSVEEAGEAVSAVIARGLIPATLEMMDRNMIGIVENYAHAGLPTDAEALLIIEADGYPQSLEPQMAEIIEVMKERQARELRLAQNAQERDRIWFARKSAFGAIAQISPAYLIVDGTVPRSKLALALAEINKICARHNLRVGYVFHAGDGNLHPLILFDPRDPDMVRRVHAAGDEVMALCVQIGGTIT
ncbi:MAG: FAD-binding protein, partial [Anaerolineae bacterium]|nr:FAD-binding protein [Anaerolineae bacterium]